MISCSSHRVKYGRLLRLPTLRLLSFCVLTTILVTGLAALTWTQVTPAVLVLGLLGSVVCVARTRAQLRLELRVVKALNHSRRRCVAEIQIPGLDEQVQAQLRSDGVTELEATTWLGAVQACGYVMASDRGFQLELLRRTATGTLAEVWGRTAAPGDRQYRRLGLTSLAATALADLEEPEAALLTAFADGVNAAWSGQGAPFECRVLGYEPTPWSPVDSVLIALMLYHSLSWTESSKRAEAVIRATLPSPLAAFLLPGAHPDLPVDLANARCDIDPEQAARLVQVDRAIPGSNCWVRRAEGSTVLAADLHLPLAMPNLLYEVDFRWDGHRLAGLVPVGLPVVLVGGNEHLAWGVTNLSADVLSLDRASEANDQTRLTEHVRVRGGPPTTVEVTRHGTGAELDRSLLGETVVARWAGQHPAALDLKFQRLAQADTVSEAVALFDQAGGIALNVIVADDAGHSAHIATGWIPGHDQPRPRVIDPADGILVSANDAALMDASSLYYDPDPGFRARRLRTVLGDLPATESAMQELQHDVQAAIYLPYRDLAVEALSTQNPSLSQLLADWDCHAAMDSPAIGVLSVLRRILVQRVLASYLQPCLDEEPGFLYSFEMVDRPVLAILYRRDATLLPPAAQRRGWDSFIADCAEEAAAATSARLPGGRPLPWAQLNQVGLHHPMEALMPWAAPLIGIAARPQSGAMHAVRTCMPGFGAACRVVLQPGGARCGQLTVEVPAGQSGHPLSPHFADRHDAWAAAAPLRRVPPRITCAYTLRGTQTAEGVR